MYIIPEKHTNYKESSILKRLLGSDHIWSSKLEDGSCHSVCL